MQRNARAPRHVRSTPRARRPDHLTADEFCAVKLRMFKPDVEERAMRDVILQQYAVSLDGFSCADGSEFQRYVFGVDDPEVDELFIETLSRAGTHIMGRATYLDMARHWPPRSTPIANVMNSIPKVVFSRS